MDEEARMTCARWEERLALWVEGDLPEREGAELERHLAACGACREVRAALEESQAALKVLASETVDAMALAAVRARVTSAVVERQPRRSFAWWPLAIPALAAALAAAILWPGEAPPPPMAARAAIPPAPPAPKMVWTKPQARPRAEHTVAASEPLLMRIETDDPNVVIYWIVEGKKGA
jgi:anti-sigma factor RsiW